MKLPNTPVYQDAREYFLSMWDPKLQVVPTDSDGTFTIDDCELYWVPGFTIWDAGKVGIVQPVWTKDSAKLVVVVGLKESLDALRSALVQSDVNFSKEMWRLQR